MIQTEEFFLPYSFVLTNLNSVLVFKVFTIEEEEFVENINLRVGKNLNLNFSCNDVAWSPQDGMFELLKNSFFKNIVD